MQKIFSPGTKVRVGMEFTQEIATMGKIYTVVAHQYTERGFVADQYIVMDSDGGVHRFSDHLLEEVEEPEVEGVTLEELLAAPYGTKAFSPYDDTVLRREERGWVTSARTRHPLSDDELAGFLPVYLVGSWL